METVEEEGSNCSQNKPVEKRFIGGIGEESLRTDESELDAEKLNERTQCQLFLRT